MTGCEILYKVSIVRVVNQEQRGFTHSSVCSYVKTKLQPRFGSGSKRSGALLPTELTPGQARSTNEVPLFGR